MFKMNAIGFALGAMLLGWGMANAQPATTAGAGSGMAVRGAPGQNGVHQGKAKAPSASASAVDAIAAAHAMVRYGDGNKDPLALVAAARVIKAESRTQLAGRPSGAGVAKADALSVDAILARARALGSGRQELLALADDVARGSSRGAHGGVRIDPTQVRSGGTDVYWLTFRAGEQARVAIAGDGDSDLDLYVYDERGTPVCRDEEPTDEASCSWTPGGSGKYQIRVRNLGSANYYRILTNGEAAREGGSIATR